MPLYITLKERNMTTQPQSHDVFSAMAEGEPYKIYKKTILGKLHLSVLNPFTQVPEGIILEGRKNEPGCFIEIWTPMEDKYLQRMNRKHFEKGYLVEYTKPINIIETSPNQITDEEIEELLNKPFKSLEHALKKFDSVAPVYRIKQMAEEMEKSEKIIKHIDARLSELELAGYEVSKDEGE